MASANSSANSRNSRHRLLTSIWTVATIILTAALVISAWGGAVSPNRSTIPALMAMALPMFVVISIIMLVINYRICRRLAIMQAVAFALSIVPIWNYCPLNIIPHAKPSADEADRVLSFMTYNTFQFEDAQGIYPKRTNRTASQIIASGADVVCVQEVGMLIDIPFRYLTKRQIDSLNRIYPYTAQEPTKLVAVLSKIPMKEITLEQPKSLYAGWTAGEIVFAGDTTLIVSVHLQSIGLNNHDKAIFHDMTSGELHSNWRGGAKIFYRKLSRAFIERASQARLLRSQLDSLGYRNVILAGDFNDIALCYAARTITDGYLHSVFAHLGRGPMITYHKNRFYFNIDHVFYAGNIKPIAMKRGNLKSSDHYPIYVDFLFGKK